MRLALALLAAGQLADVVTTLYGLAHGGAEGNAVVSWLLADGYGFLNPHVGLVAWLIGKALTVAFVALVVSEAPRLRTVFRIAASVGAAALFMVAGHNLAAGGI